MVRNVLFFLLALVLWSPAAQAEPDLQRVYFKKISEAHGYTKVSWKAEVYCDEASMCYIQIKLLDGQGFEQGQIVDAVQLVDGYQTLTGSHLTKTETWDLIKDYKGAFVCP